MSRRHATIIALILALAAVAGGVAAMRTAHVGAAARTAGLDAQVAQRTSELNRAEAALRRAVAQAAAPVRTASPAAPPRPQRVVYVRPAPRVVTVHRHGEGEAETALAAEGGSFDD